MKLRLFFNPRDPAQLAQWQKLKAQGQRSYILRRGVVGYGGTMFVLMTATDLVRNPPSRYVFDVAINLLIWPLAGYLWGLSMWHFFDHVGKKQMADGGSQSRNER
jgi:hypothetical protein